MIESNGSVPFSQRLRELLEQHGLTQSCLAKRSGVERSTISRLIRENRTPSMNTVECIAPVLGIEIKLLLDGTDAASQLSENTDLVRRQDFIAAVQKMVEYEGRVKELEIELRVARQLHDKEQEIRREAQDRLEKAETAQAVDRVRNEELHKTLKRHRRALKDAVAEISSLRAQLRDLGKEVKSASNSSRTAAILAGLAALAGAVTVATYLRDDDDADGSEPSGTPPGMKNKQRSQS